MPGALPSRPPTLQSTPPASAPMLAAVRSRLLGGGGLLRAGRPSVQFAAPAGLANRCVVFLKRGACRPHTCGG